MKNNNDEIVIVGIGASAGGLANLKSFIKNLPIKSNISLINGGYGGTSPIIYQKTPYYIHLFAKEIGEDNFFRFLKEFYSDVQKKKEINITNFKKILNKNGISNNQWQNFINKL